MIYLDLIIGFLKVGMFSFGGAYGAIPLIRDVVLHYGWMDEEALVNMIAISESTPGPIMVNLATYVGSSKAGILGGILATISVVSPAYILIILLMTLLNRLSGKKWVKAAFNGIKPCIIGIILAMGVSMIGKNSLTPILTKKDILPAVMTIVLAAVYFGFRKIFKKKMSPIVLILIAAFAGIAVYLF
ncbi:chromate transporter [Butyrivibrio sp. WCD3002]|uniref:chromate transporter n=1 Tax=Butyrivibrio sp. WCD3002 TaxID=1280676 RepID=UPI000419E34C|nr:chromate transporter [Butyrivibrio sp. WCD3002]